MLKTVQISRNGILFVDFEEFLHDSAVSHAVHHDKLVEIPLQLPASLLHHLLLAAVEIRLRERTRDDLAVGQSVVLEHHHEDAVEL